ncbi:hypothetical protein KW844_12780 [Chitinophaga sp. sic0106]|nr:hypothetical protein [Chitinophaga sp. sic0106]
METLDGRQAVYAATRAEWRKWLRENSQTEAGVWLIQYRKHSKVPCISLIEATEEALCFGWIDSKAKRRDPESFYLTFTPRKAKSKWSKPNIERATRLIAEGLMTEFGQEKIDLAKRTGMWVEML